MRLTRLCIRNFRALESVDVVINPMTVIIGENDVGKSSCMLGLRTFFECKKLELLSDIFMRRADLIVSIECEFHCPSPNELQRRFVAGGALLRIRCTYALGAARTIEVKASAPRDARFRDFAEKGVADLRALLTELGAMPEGPRPDKSACQRLLSQWFEANLRAEDYEDVWVSIKEVEFAAIVPDFILVPVMRDLDSSMKMTESSIFGKLFRPIFSQIVADPAVAPTLDNLQRRLSAGVAARVFDLQTLMRSQMNNDSVSLTHEVGLDPIKGLSFEFGMDDERARDIPLSNRGAGVHNNLTLGMFRLLAKYKASNFILAIEEPENSLHPRGQREMLWALQDIARTAQVLCTTHSSVFLDLGRMEDNIVLVRTSSGNTVSKNFSATDTAALRELLGIRVSDALLGGGGNCAMIVEGATELHAYPHFFKICDRDARALGVSIINAEGSDSERIKRLSTVLNAYRIPTVVVLDRDAAAHADDLRRFGPGSALECLRRVFVLQDGSFESYIPIDVAVAVMNSSFSVGEEIVEADIDPSRGREAEFRRVLHQKKPGARFEHFKVEFGELVGRRMHEQGIALHQEIREIVEFVAQCATAG